MTAMSGYIDDGYTRDDGYIEASPKGKNGESLWAPLEFSYRIAARMEVVKHDARLRVINRDVEDAIDAAVATEKEACQFVADHLKDWSLRDRGNHPVKVSPETCARLNPGLFNRLYRIVRGGDVSDPKPQQEKAPPSDAEMLGNSEAVSG